MSMELLSVRELQAYGAACLARYCAAKGIHSKHVEWLVDHLLLALVSTRLPVWETAGTMFELTGRGDPLPADLVELLPEHELASFERLVSCVVGIGMVDMYGGDTSQSLRSARESREVLESADVEQPSVEDLFPSRGEKVERGWGEPVTAEQYRHARDWCLRTIKPRPSGV